LASAGRAARCCAGIRETIEAQDWLIKGGKDFAFVCEHAGIGAEMINA
jgi:hypothetical protein